MDRIRLIATDMDGTLLGRALDRIPGANAEALRAAAEAGAALVLATGRQPDDAGFFALDAGLRVRVVGLNGCAVAEEPLGTVARTCLIRPETARKVRRVIEECALSFGLFGLHDVAVSEPPEDPRAAMLVFGTFFDRPGGRTRFWTEGEMVERLLVRTAKFVVDAHEHPDRLRTLKARLAAEVPEAQVTSSWADTIEIMPPEVSKGEALADLAARLGIPMAQVMALGDNDNDVSMLAAAGCAVAVANATPAAKAAAHWIAPSNLEDGVATAVRALALGDEAALASLLPGGRTLGN